MGKGTEWLKKHFPEHGVWVSLLHTEGLVEAQWREVTRMFDEAGADGFELNFPAHMAWRSPEGERPLAATRR